MGGGLAGTAQFFEQNLGLYPGLLFAGLATLLGGFDPVMGFLPERLFGIQPRRLGRGQRLGQRHAFDGVRVAGRRNRGFDPGQAFRGDGAAVLVAHAQENLVVSALLLCLQRHDGLAEQLEAIFLERVVDAGCPLHLAAPAHQVDVVLLPGLDPVPARLLRGGGALLGGEDEFVRTEIAAVVTAAAGATVKVILEIAYLNDDQIVRACRQIEAANAHFVKTSTGFAPSGYTLEALKLMRASGCYRLTFGIESAFDFPRNVPVNIPVILGLDPGSKSEIHTAVSQFSNCH